MRQSCAFSVIPGRYAIARFPVGTALPLDALSAPEFASITRTRDELSIVCREDRVPPGHASEGGWLVLKLHGPFAFDQVGILVSIAAPLADHGVSIFAVSTFDTDYILIKADQLDRAIDALETAGHTFVR